MKFLFLFFLCVSSAILSFEIFLFFRIILFRFLFLYNLFLIRHPLVILTLSDYSLFALPFVILVCPTLVLLYAQIISDNNTIYLSCAILELSGTIPESADKVRIPTLRRTILELYRFLLYAEHIHVIIF